MTIKKRITTLVITFILLLGAISYWSYLNIDDHKALLFTDVISRVETSDNVIALTFDDGPKPKRTEAILNILAQENIKATFFLNGHTLKKHHQQTSLLVASGHQLANHGYSHKGMVTMSYDTIATEIESTEKILRDHGYTDELHFRPPYGKGFINLDRYLRDHAIKAVTWDVEPETWDEPRADTQEQVRRALEQTRSGSIIIMHVMYGDENSINAVPLMIRALKTKGYQFLTIDELLAYQSTAP